MAYEEKNMAGSLWPNQYKDSETKPDFKGTVTIEGKQWTLAAWASKTKAGADYYSLKASEPYKKPVETEEEPSF
jgi:uncharacterized protein (DUF736 family)